MQIPNNHLFGQGCIICSNINKGNYLKFSLTQFIEKANKIHNNKFDYSKSIYKNAKTNIKIICPIHGEFFTNSF